MKIKLNIQQPKKTKMLYFRVNETDYEILKKMAKKNKVKVSVLLRAFVEATIKNVE